MKIYDSVKKEEVEIADYKDLIKIMKDGRQVDLYLKEKKSDDMGYPVSYTHLTLPTKHAV